MSNNKMEGFILAMYGTVLGISFFHVFSIDIAAGDEFKKLVDVKQILSFFSKDVILFRYSLFFFTILILAHDWHSFHNRKNIQFKKFISYLPQITSLFFLSQMFAAASAGDFKIWLFYAIFYTVANVLGFLADLIFGDTRPLWYIIGYALIYVVHICITVCGFYKAHRPYMAYVNKNTDWCLFLLVALIVIALWIVMQIIDTRESKLKTDVTGN